MAALFKKAPVAQEELDKARACGKWDQVVLLEQRYKSKSLSSKCTPYNIAHYTGYH